MEIKFCTWCTTWQNTFLVHYMLHGTPSACHCFTSGQSGKQKVSFSPLSSSMPVQICPPVPPLLTIGDVRFSVILSPFSFFMEKLWYFSVTSSGLSFPQHYISNPGQRSHDCFSSFVSLPSSFSHNPINPPLHMLSTIKYSSISQPLSLSLSRNDGKLTSLSLLGLIDWLIVPYAPRFAVLTVMWGCLLWFGIGKSSHGA